MCDICLHTPCHSQCPNAPEPKSIGKCKYCDEPIYVGDEYVEVCDGELYHEDCFLDTAAGIMLSKGYAVKGTA